MKGNERKKGSNCQMFWVNTLESPFGEWINALNSERKAPIIIVANKFACNVTVVDTNFEYTQNHVLLYHKVTWNIILLIDYATSTWVQLIKIAKSRDLSFVRCLLFSLPREFRKMYRQIQFIKFVPDDARARNAPAESWN